MVLKKKYMTKKEVFNILNKESKNRFKLNRLLSKKDIKYVEFGTLKELIAHADVFHKLHRDSTIYKTKKGKPILLVYW